MKLETQILTFIDKTGYIKCKGVFDRGTRFECPSLPQEHRSTMTTKKTNKQADVELLPAVSDCLKGL